MSTLVPDPFTFALDALRLRGALVDTDADADADADEGGALVLVPSEVATPLGVPDEFRLTRRREDAGATDAIPWGLGSPLLDALLSDLRGGARWSHARLDVPEPRPSYAASLAERFQIRNGLAKVEGVARGEATYVFAFVTYVAEADDRHEGLITVAAEGASGAVPDEPFLARVDVRSGSDLTDVTDLDAPEPPRSDATLAVLARRACDVASARLATIVGPIERRHRRDHARIRAYFASLVDEARAPKRRTPPEAVAAKVAHLTGEREAKLVELDTRFTLRASLRPAALLFVAAPVVRISLQVVRRKARGELVLTLPGGAQAFDALPCASCRRPSPRPALCDDQLHVLCEACVPNAQGRPECGACRTGVRA